MTERKMVAKEVATLTVDECTLLEIKQEVERLIVQYGNDATVSKETYSYSEGTYLAVMVRVPESDEQYNTRIARERQFEEAREARDLAEFKRLSAKFGG